MVNWWWGDGALTYYTYLVRLQLCINGHRHNLRFFYSCCFARFQVDFNTILTLLSGSPVLSCPVDTCLPLELSEHSLNLVRAAETTMVIKKRVPMLEVQEIITPASEENTVLLAKPDGTLGTHAHLKNAQKGLHWMLYWMGNVNEQRSWWYSQWRCPHSVPRNHLNLVLAVIVEATTYLLNYWNNSFLDSL